MEVVGEAAVLEEAVADLEVVEVVVLADLAAAAAHLAAEVRAEAGKQIFVCFSLKLLDGFCKIGMRLFIFNKIFSF